MSTFTKFLNLFKWQPDIDGDEEFDIDKSLNENWDKIDTKLETYMTELSNDVEVFKNNTDTQVEEIGKQVNGLREISISPTQPTSNESVWIKTGKNRFDKRNLEIVEHWNVNYTVDESKKITVTVPQVTQAVAYIKTSNFVIPKGQHTISLKIEGQLNTMKLINAYNTDICIKDTNENTFTVDLAEDTTVFLYIYINPSSTANTLTIENIQIEKGNTATVYEEYTDKEIYVKNENGVFERFYSENEMNKQNYSQTEQKIGTWIDGKTLYRKTIYKVVAITANTDLVINSETQNIDKIVKIDGVISSSNGVTYRQINTYNLENNITSCSMNAKIDGNIIIRSTEDWSSPNIIVTLEYTKTTD